MEVKPLIPNEVKKETIIVLDVGGMIHKTNKKTLMEHSGYFRTMLNSFREGEEKNPIFIDRDGELFRQLLYFMRTHRVWNSTLTHDLLEEADYYDISGLEEALYQGHWKISTKKIDRERQLVGTTHKNTKMFEIVEDNLHFTNDHCLYGEYTYRHLECSEECPDTCKVKQIPKYTYRIREFTHGCSWPLFKSCDGFDIYRKKIK